MKATRNHDGAYTFEGTPQEMRELLAKPQPFRESTVEEIETVARTYGIPIVRTQAIGKLVKQ